MTLMDRLLWALITVFILVFVYGTVFLTHIPDFGGH